MTAEEMPVPEGAHVADEMPDAPVPGPAHPGGAVPIGGPGRFRVRIRFTKVGKIRWTSHRDVARMWERAFRRLGLPLSYSEGFSPRPRVSFGLALPTGHESLAEYLDVELTDLDSVDLDGLATRLSGALPVGVDATAVSVIPPGTPSLQEDVLSCTWDWVAVPAEYGDPTPSGNGEPTLGGAGDPSPEGDSRSVAAVTIAERLSSVMAATEVLVTRTRKGVEVTEDVRGGIEELELVGPAGPDHPGGHRLHAVLGCQPRSVRPAEVLTALGPGLEERDVRRTHQWILRDGVRREPLLATPGEDADDAPHALERAS